MMSKLAFNVDDFLLTEVDDVDFDERLPHRPIAQARSAMSCLCDAES